MAVVVQIAGVDRSSKVDRRSLSWTLKSGRRNDCSFHMSDLSDSYRPVVGQSVQVTAGGTPVFGGSIDEYSESHQVPGTRSFSIRCVSHEQRIDKRLVIGSFGRMFCRVNATTDVIESDGVDGLQSGYPVFFGSDGTVPGGLSASTKYYWIRLSSTTGQLATSPGGGSVDITSAGTGNLFLIWCTGSIVRWFVGSQVEGVTAGTISDGVPITLAVFDREPMFQAIDSLARVSDYVTYVDPSAQLQFVPRTTYSAPITFAAPHVLSSRKISFPTFRYTRQDYANQVFARLADVSALSLVNFTGNSIKRQFFLAFPVREIGSVSVNSTPQVVEPYGSSDPADWYYIPGGHWIIQAAGGATLTSSQTLSVSYKGYFLDVVDAFDSGEWLVRAGIEGGSGIHERIVDAGTLDSTGAQQLANSELAIRKSVAIELTFDTDTHGCQPSQLFSVNRSDFGVNTSFMIDQVVARDIEMAYIRYSITALSGTRLGDWFATYQQFLAGAGGGASSTVSGSAGGGGGASSNFLLASTLSSPSTSIAYGIQPSGSVLIVVLTQDGTGGRQITWGADFHGGTPVDIDTRPNRRNTAFFYSDGGNWRILGGFEVE